MEAEKILKRYPDKIPIIVDTDSDFILDKYKYLVPKELTVAQFVYVIRKKTKLPPEKAIFLFVGKSIPPSVSSLGFIYDSNKSDDNFLYISIRGENVFG